jgi:hypothetical protein|tara:strand:+ start:76 stop:471 length:396 start_codon:yes stop_codon:yes gene_type:complete
MKIKTNFFLIILFSFLFTTNSFCQYENYCDCSNHDLIKEINQKLDKEIKVPCSTSCKNLIMFECFLDCKEATKLPETYYETPRQHYLNNVDYLKTVIERNGCECESINTTISGKKDAQKKKNPKEGSASPF